MAPPSKPKTFTLAQVAAHNTPTDCWIVIHGKVYDVTSYLEEHPGGDDVLLEATGKDATDDFEDVGHSEDARKLMEQYYIADLDLSTQKQPCDLCETTFGFAKKVLPIAIPVAFLGLAIICVYARKKRE